MVKATSATMMYEPLVVGLMKGSMNRTQAIAYLNKVMKPKGIDLTKTEYNCSYGTRFDEKVANLFKHTTTNGNVLVNYGIVIISGEHHNVMTITKKAKRAFLYKNREFMALLRTNDFKGLAKLIKA